MDITGSKRADFIDIYIMAMLIFFIPILVISSYGSFRHWFNEEIYWVRCICVIILLVGFVGSLWQFFSPEKYPIFYGLMFLPILCLFIPLVFSLAKYPNYLKR